MVEGFRRVAGDEVAEIARRSYAGELDPVTPVAAEEIAGALPEATAQLEIINGAGHFTWEDAPDRYWPIITEFITRTIGRELADA